MLIVTAFAFESKSEHQYRDPSTINLYLLKPEEVRDGSKKKVKESGKRSEQLMSTGKQTYIERLLGKASACISPVIKETQVSIFSLIHPIA